MLRTLGLMMACVSTSGCVAGAVAASMGANLAVSEAVSSGTTPNVEMTGEDVYQLAEWDDRHTRATATIFGRDEWTCARGAPGTVVCVPPEQATEESVRRDVIFGCRYGQGGIVSNLFGGSDMTTLFCERRAS